MKNILPKLRGSLQQNHPLADYTSWKVGGPAEYFYEPADLEDLKVFLQNWRKQPIVMLGSATNVLIRDNGIKGTVIYLRNHLEGLNELDKFTLRAEAGVSIARLVKKCTDLHMVDAAFLTGIPGTVGGALTMNAGAYGDYIWNHVVAVETINHLGEVKLRQAEEFTADYREVKGLGKKEWFVAAQLTFARNNAQNMKQKISKYLQKRKKSQPLDLPSCGSVFRNPEDDHAARLIEASGFKGKQVGGAKISEKHANFIVNCGGAKAADIETLMQQVITVVKINYNVELIPEVRILGEK